jgi:origin recognition complex subunit 3
MSDPNFYLPSAGSVGDQTSLDPNIPDLCIAYQLHLECGRHINLYDWLTV